MITAPAQIRRDSVSVHTVSITPPVILVAWGPPEINNGSIIAYEYCWSRSGNRPECANTIGNSTTINLPTNCESALKITNFYSGLQIIVIMQR